MKQGKALTSAEELSAREARLAEERFLLAAQRALQRLLSSKGLRYRDLARRLGVSEARVSHIFGDDAANLTMRTVARVFYVLNEKAVIFSEGEYQGELAQARGCAQSEVATWTVSGDADYVWLDHSAEAVAVVNLPRDTARPATTREWALAEDAAQRRGRAA